MSSFILYLLGCDFYINLRRQIGRGSLFTDLHGGLG
jgi:hypothetical protein